MRLKDYILYEDEHLLAIHKPAGLVVHGDGRTEEASVASLILEEYPEMKDIGEPWTTPQGLVIPRPGIVHRLDRDTSGVLLITKTQEFFEHLKLQFKNHTLKKTYHAFVYGHVKKDDDIIDKPIGRSTTDFRMYSAMRGARGEMREAVTEYKTLSRFEESGEKFSFVELHPQTGRTHQIRVHMKYLNHPIVCDPLYAQGKSPALGFSRTALHASNIVVSLLSGKTIEIKAPFPEDFEKQIKDLGLQM